MTRRMTVLTDSEKQDLSDVVTKYNLLDKDWYLSVNPDVAQAQVDPVDHYLRDGIAEGRSPHPLFWAAYYLDRYQDIQASGIDPLFHYIFYGGAERRSPHPFLAAHWLARQLGPDLPLDNPLLGLITAPASSLTGPRPLFDIKHMRQAQGQAEGTPMQAVLTRYFITPMAQRIAPNALFDPDFVRQKADLSQSTDAVLAYLQQTGTALQPYPLFDADLVRRTHNRSPDPEPEPELTLLDLAMSDDWLVGPDISALFDPAYYRQQLSDECEDESLISHYLRIGARQGLDPNPWFDSKLYISRYLANDPYISPLVHYSLYGRNSHITLLPRFQDRFYTMRYPEVLETYPRTPLEHYINFGLSEGRVLNAPAWSDDFAAWDEVKADVIRLLADTDNSAPQVSVIIPVYNQFQFTLRCIWSILRAGDAARLQIIIADDGSQDETQGFFSAIPQVTYLRNPENLGFLNSCNHAALSATADYLFFLNNDTAVLPGWIDRLLETARALPEAGLIGAKLMYPDGTLQEAGGYIWADGSGANLGRHDDPDHPGFNFRRDADYVSGAAILLPRSVWQAVGGFDPRYAPAYYEDADLALRLRNLGWRVIYQPASVVVHFEGISSGTSLDSGIKAFQVANQVKLVEKWGFALQTHAANHPVAPAAVPRPARPRILIIDAVVPEPDKDAGSVVAKWYMRLLIDLGYDVTFAAHNLQLNGQAGRDLQALGVEVLYVPYVRSVAAYLDAHAKDFDLFLLYRYAAGGAFIEQIRALCPQTPIVFNTVDLHHLREERQARQNGDDPLALAAARQTKERELRVMDLATETILLSQTELAVMAQRGSTSRISVIPLVLEVDAVVAPRVGRDGITFIGSYGHPPNIDAVLYFIDAIWPLVHAQLPDLVLHIVGANPPPEIAKTTAPGVQVHGHVADLGAFMAARIASIAPLRYGAGIKGKIASSLAAGLPCVATSAGAEGMGLVAGRDLLVADAPQDFADAIVRLCEDSALWSDLSRNGQAVIGAQYSPHVTRKRLLRLLAKAGAAPFAGLCPLTGLPETRRFQSADAPGSLSAGPGAPDSPERIAASALIRIAKSRSGVRSLAALPPGALPAVAVLGVMPNLTRTLTGLGALVAPALAEIAVLTLTLGPDVTATLTSALASLSPACHRLVLPVVPEGPLGNARTPAALAAVVRQLEATGWQVRLEAIPAKESALTGVVLIEGRLVKLGKTEND